MKKKRVKYAAVLLATTVLTMGFPAVLGEKAFAATGNQKTIEVNSQQIAAVSGIVFHSTTYMPIWYVMRALTLLGITNTWDGKNWSISAGNGTPLGPSSSGTSGDAIVVNGSVLYRLRGLASSGTTYMPIWYVMQMLTKIGIHNTWDGTNWNIIGTPQGGAPASTTSEPGAAATSATSAMSTGTVPTTGTSAGNSSTEAALNSVRMPLPNDAKDDSGYWSRANSSIYIEANSYPFYQKNSGPAMLSIEPGDKVYLTVASSEGNVSSSPRWFVNSPDATVTPGPANDVFSVGQYQAGVGVFTATKPGIYTVQAESNSVYSEPLVLLVGVSQLKSDKSLAASSAVGGVQALPSNLPSVSADTEGNVTYRRYQPINGWLPVSGSVSGASSVVIYLKSETSSTDEWTYRLPIKNDHFSGMVRIPFVSHGITVSFETGFNHSLTSQGGFSYSTQYTVANNVAIGRQDKALLGSAEMDVNMSPEFANEASILTENAPSRQTGIVAINNYAAEKMLYDIPEYNAGVSIWYDALTEWTHQLGVCQNIAEMAATMMKSIGIPVETVLGAAPRGNTENHEWLQVYNGSAWEILDPTWDTPNNGQDMTKDTLTNQYNANSPDFQSSHTYIALGGWQ